MLRRSAIDKKQVRRGGGSRRARMGENKKRGKKGAATGGSALLYWHADVGDGQRRGTTRRVRKGGA
jgi:hypothetical protein